MSQNHPFDASIPVLTEVFQDQPVKKEAPEPAESKAAEVVAAEAVADEAPAPPLGEAELEARAIDTWTEPQWALLERRLSERVLQQLQGRVDFVLEQRLRDSMADALQHAIEGLTSEIRDSLQQTIEKIVVRAVAQELAHLQTLKK
jgi:hypothetical protein